MRFSFIAYIKNLLVHSTDAKEYSPYIESRNLYNLIMSPFCDDC